MIEQLLDKDLSQVIVDRIKKQFAQHHQLSKAESNLYYRPYTQGRKTYDLTAAVLSGFAADRFSVPGINVVDVPYGLGHRLGQPELQGRGLLIQIYSNGSDLKGRVIEDRCTKYNKDFSTKPVFLLIVFHRNAKYELTRVEAYLPDQSGVIIEKKCLYTNVVPMTKTG